MIARNIRRAGYKTVRAVGRYLIAFVVVCLIVVAGYVWWPMQTSDRPVLEVGKTYDVLFLCLPQVGCYGETFTVLRIDGDWLLTMHAQSGEHWWVQRSQIMAVKSSQREGLVVKRVRKS